MAPQHEPVALPTPTARKLRWTVAENADPTLFPDESAVDRHIGKGEYRGMEFLHVNAKKIINEVPGASRMPFRFTINSYRGCSHACSYCYARSTHAYLDLNIGSDFDSKIVVKVNAVERLRAELASAKWMGDGIAMGTNTDPYQKAEGKYHLTRRIIETLSAARNPFSILTKSTLILRDLDVLRAANEHTDVQISMSIPTLDRAVWKMTEPGTPPPDKRVAALKTFNAAGISGGVLIAPILPGLSDSPDQLREVVNACVDAGATSIFASGLHLRPGVKEHYLEWLTKNRPDLDALYKERFGRRSYQQRSTLHDLSATVQEMVQDARKELGGPPVRRQFWRQMSVPRQSVASLTPQPGGEQLGLFGRAAKSG